MDGPVQPARPRTHTEYLELRDAGVLINMAGRPLEFHPCPFCDGEKTGNDVCPVEVECPDCHSPAGRDRCIRPSGHEASTFHKARRELADRLTDERVAAGGLTIAAPWPA